MTRKMAHSSKCLPWKHEDLSSDLQYPFKKLGVAVGCAGGTIQRQVHLKAQ